MANETMTLIASSTVGAGGASTIDFTSIPQTYTDLQIVVSARSSKTANDDSMVFNLNGVATNQSSRFMQGSGSAASSGSAGLLFAGQLNGNTSTSNTFGTTTVYLPNYSGSTNKSSSVDSVSENNGTAAVQSLFANLWSSTAAITSISMYFYGGTILQYTTASLYGILKGSGGASVS